MISKAMQKYAKGLPSFRDVVVVAPNNATEILVG
jgi:hypothetical protein